VLGIGYIKSMDHHGRNPKVQTDWLASNIDKFQVKKHLTKDSLKSQKSIDRMCASERAEREH
jgi:hypothetical protein